MSLHLSLITAVISTSSLKQKPKKSDEKRVDNFDQLFVDTFFATFESSFHQIIFCYNNPKMQEKETTSNVSTFFCFFGGLGGN